MSDKVLLGDPPITLCLRRSGRARRISLRISQLDGRVTLTLPPGVREAEALDFAREKESWIRKHLAKRQEDIPVSIGIRLPFAGHPFEVRRGSGRSVRLDNGMIHVPGAPERAGAKLAGFLKAQARVRLAESSHRYAERLGKSFSALTLRDTRSRWGSCTATGRLMYSWRLIMAPAEVLDYVAAHEVAHLAEMNHSPAFWAKVTRLYGDYAEARLWLRRHGSDLHRYRFE